VDPAAVAECKDDLFAVGVRLTTGDSSVCDVPPAPAAEWARDFEEAFAGFDGADGRLRVLLGAGGPWVLRWSRKAGAWAEFPGGEAAYFTFAPLSTVPMSGTAQVMAYDDATLQPAGESTATFRMVDLDAWGQAFLAALDDLAAPGMAEAIARLDEAAHAELVGRRTRLAQALSLRLVPAYTGPLRGDVEAARGEVEKALLDSLARAYTVSAVVQVPASVHAAGEPSTAPRLIGPVTARGDTCTTSAATLPLQARHLTFMVSAADPREAAALPLEAMYDVRHVGGEGAGTLEFAGDALVFPLQPLHVPVPLRALPAPPVLIRQTAAGAGKQDADELRGVLRWDYTVELGVPGKGAQDDLWVEVTRNLPADAERARTTRGPAGGATGLFEALAAFHTAWATLSPLLPRIACEPETPGPTALQVLAAVMAHVASVTDRWGALDEAPPSAADSAESGELMISFARADTESQLDVFARLDPSRAEEWPSINEQRPTADPVALTAAGWYQCSYPFSGGDALTLRWRALDLLSCQSARSTCRVVRNASLPAGLVYRTAPVSFASPVLPLIEVDRIGPLPSCATMAEALAQVLLPVSRAGTEALGERFLEVAISYDDPLPPGAGARTATHPVLVSEVFPLGSADSLTTLVAALVQRVNTWREQTRCPTAGALLLLQVDLPGAVHLHRVEITVPPDWW
jgi:hypothetical protein